VSRLAIDLQHRTLSFRSSDGRGLDMPMPAEMFVEPTNLQCVDLHVDAARLVITMPGECAEVELRRPGEDLDELRAGRPTVYLDQNHWSTLAAARHGHRPVREGEAEAALRLAKLVEDRRILLPVSAGHLVETTPLYGARRVALAGTVLSLGRGWQMRNPLHVRVNEMLHAVLGVEPVASEVFAPGADGFFSSVGDPGGSPSGNPGLATALEQVGRLVPDVLGLYDAVVDEQAIPDEGGAAHAAAESWARGLAQLATTLRAADEPASMVRRVASARMLADMTDDLIRVAHEAGVTPEEVIVRLTAADDPVARMPFLAQMRQMLFARLRNADQAWEASDLVDIMFLCCAAGYADLVVGERRTIGYLRQARQPPPHARLASSLQEAVRALDEA
jgi:hypothetical protein